MTRTPSRRSPLGLAALATAALLALAGCAPTDAPEPSDTPTSSLLPAAEGTTEYPLTLVTPFGETVLEERPERIAVVGLSPNVDALQALGVTPVYTVGDGEPAFEWRDADWLSGIELVDTATRSDPTNYEGIASTEPDLIIATNWIFDEEEYAKLSAIAPVLDNEELIDGDKVEWQQTQRLIGEVLDLRERADQLVNEAEDAIAAVAASHPEFDGKTVTIFTDYGEEYGISYYTVAGGTAESVLLDLGFAPNPTAEQFVNDETVSEENQQLLDADVLVGLYFEPSVREAREAQPLFQAIPAVAEGRYVSLTSTEDYTKLVTADGTETGYLIWVLRRGSSVVTLPWAAEVIADQWLADVDLP